MSGIWSTARRERLRKRLSPFLGGILAGAEPKIIDCTEILERSVSSALIFETRHAGAGDYFLDS